ncbi:Uncharacterised protein [Mycobacterium tuberculosis]|uniref:Secreted protein n=1 Tax=Mycobacterium tuberculosis TaxID=1773 RepID=A0A0T9AQX7_MYCTX|nr:Uncharacterised protein [Mycobacterium tuberculosis]CFE72228.1 Uncharacterised protein [Mycobacterium tuberculosis]CFR78526.1 Uncharacterised protein [Mycobacterium tuberculosis]CFR85474.1 Uncharacterised protein [Mycobacterium tuberculosis]CKO01197.1 Uncharacterised protein [Mycobacterium tuberculosis]
MYWAVPITMPVWVTGAASTALAMPKSVIFTCPVGVIKMLPGLTSRCTRPAACAICRARPVCSSMSSACRNDSRPVRLSTEFSGSPLTSSITR